MKATELQLINQFRKQFKERFNRALHIDFIAMNGVVEEIIPLRTLVRTTPPHLKDVIDELAKKHRVDIEEFKQETKRNGQPEHYSGFIKEYCALVYSKGWNINEAMKAVGRDRSCLYFHLKLGKYANTKKIEEK